MEEVVDNVEQKSDSLETSQEDFTNSYYEDYDEYADDEEKKKSVNNFSSPIATRLAKLQTLRQKMQKVEVANRKDIIQEQDSQSLSPSLIEKLHKRKQKEKEIQEHGDLHERYENLKYSIQDVEDWETSKSKKRERVNTGFIDFQQASYKKYKRMLHQLQPDLDNYEAQKNSAERNGEINTFFGQSEASSSFFKPGKEDVDRLVQDLNKQVEIRSKSSRRRAYDVNEDVTYINDKNRTFNQKISRAFDKYTKEIKDSLERGTAL